MKFFVFTLISSYSFECSADLYDVPNIPEPSHRLYFLYSKHHIQLPKSDDPNIFSSVLETQSVIDGKYVLSFSSLKHLHLKMEGIQHVCAHDLYSQLPSKYEHFHYHKSESEDLGNAVEHHLSKLDNDISSPKQYASLIDLLYVNYGDSQPYSKTNTFIETKVTAIKLQSLNF